MTVYAGSNTLSNIVQTPANCDGCSRDLGSIHEEDGIVWYFTSGRAGQVQHARARSDREYRPQLLPGTRKLLPQPVAGQADTHYRQTAARDQSRQHKRPEQSLVELPDTDDNVNAVRPQSHTAQQQLPQDHAGCEIRLLETLRFQLPASSSRLGAGGCELTTSRPFPRSPFPPSTSRSPRPPSARRRTCSRSRRR